MAEFSTPVTSFTLFYITIWIRDMSEVNTWPVWSYFFNIIILRSVINSTMAKDPYYYYLQLKQVPLGHFVKYDWFRMSHVCMILGIVLSGFSSDIRNC